MKNRNRNLNRTALITGASKRIGKAMSIHLASQGWNIAIHYNSSPEPAKQLQRHLQQKYPENQFGTFQANLMELMEVQQLIAKVLSEFRSVDLLINNASVFEPSPLKETSVELFERLMAINFHAPFLLSRNYANSTKNGLIVNLVDSRITNNQSNYAAYSLSKKALWELTKMAALEFAPGIRVNAIAPGVTLPPADKDENYLLELANKIPMKKPTGLDPILHSLDYIIKNDLLTGQLLFADGGENLGKN
jgi:NAD(P)-dependent dehydrogenase (short-subunit alcohol dehydrogenase family)